MQLTTEKSEEFQIWLHVIHFKEECPMCGTRCKMAAHSSVYCLPHFADPSREAQFLAIGCSECGATQFFDAKVVGIEVERPLAHTSALVNGGSSLAPNFGTECSSA